MHTPSSSGKHWYSPTAVFVPALLSVLYGVIRPSSASWRPGFRLGCSASDERLEEASDLRLVHRLALVVDDLRRDEARVVADQRARVDDGLHVDVEVEPARRDERRAAADVSLVRASLLVQEVRHKLRQV
eukprot:scaffold91096_cov62-Phaeocystis_antarctica.AAC.6